MGKMRNFFALIYILCFVSALKDWYETDLSLFFKAGTNPIAFEPDYIYSITMEDGQWSEPEQGLKEGEIIWQMAFERGTYYSCSYAGEHYTITQMGGIDQHFNKSSDGVNWEPVNSENEVPYRGGISEIGWAFDLDGNIWGVGRNEDGDDSGWGSRIF